MSTFTFPASEDEEVVRTLYEALIGSWNKRSAADYATLFAETANVVGFDGSIINGRDAIQAELNRIFLIM